MAKNVALITGVTGQDGSYLSEFLLSKGYEVHGIIRRSSVDYRERIAHLENLNSPSKGDGGLTPPIRGLGGPSICIMQI